MSIGRGWACVNRKLNKEGLCSLKMGREWRAGLEVGVMRQAFKVEKTIYVERIHLSAIAASA